MIPIVREVLARTTSNPLLLILYGKTLIFAFSEHATLCHAEPPISRNSATSPQSGSIEESVWKCVEHIQSALIGLVKSLSLRFCFKEPEIFHKLHTCQVSMSIHIA